MQSLLPKPKHSKSKWQNDSDDDETPQQKPSKIPPYPFRSSFKPLSLEDYGNGGSYPEVNILQYPLDMGRKDAKTNALALTTVNGELNYASILNPKRDKVVHSTMSDYKEQDYEDVDKPSQEAIEATRIKTQTALEKLVTKKISSYTPKNNAFSGQTSEFVRYTPQTGDESSSSRIVKVVSAPVDPLEPPRFGHKKIPRFVLPNVQWSSVPSTSGAAFAAS